MRDYLIINGKNLKEFGVYAFGNSIHDFPERVVEKISIPGRTGDLLVDKGKWENIDVEYSMVLLDGANLDYLRAFLLSLRGYVRIESTFEPDYYRMGRFVEASSPKVHKEAATVTLVFDCIPWKYLKSGEREVEVVETAGEQGSAVFYNPTVYTAKPLLLLYPYAMGTNPRVQIGNDSYALNTIEIYPDADAFYIDFEAETAYTIGGVNAWQYIKYFPKGGFELFSTGRIPVNAVDMGFVTITPKWRTL